MQSDGDGKMQIYTIGCTAAEHKGLVHELTERL